MFRGEQIKFVVCIGLALLDRPALANRVHEPRGALVGDKQYSLAAVAPLCIKKRLSYALPNLRECLRTFRHAIKPFSKISEVGAPGDNRLAIIYTNIHFAEAFINHYCRI